MATAARDTSDEGQIRGLFDGWLTALRAKDVNGRTAGCAADGGLRSGRRCFRRHQPDAACRVGWAQEKAREVVLDIHEPD